MRLKATCWGGQSPPAALQSLLDEMKDDDPGGTAADDPGGTAVGANVCDASPAAVSSLSAPTTSSSRIPPLHANGMSNNMSTEMTVMSKLEALESSWDFSALHAELDVICPLADNDDVLWCASCVETGVGAVGGVEL